LSANETVGSGRHIAELCEILDADVFDDFSKFRHIFNFFLRPGGLQKFLSQMVVGYELLVRLQREKSTKRYIDLIGPKALGSLVIADRSMKNMKIRFLDSENAEVPYSDSAPQIEFLVSNRERQIDGILTFARLMRWPYMDELRKSVGHDVDVFRPGDVEPALLDWLLGLTLPGKEFRARIMRCVMAATESTRHVPHATNFLEGLVLPDGTYWPTITAMGAVLGGMTGVKTVCGWTGPCPMVKNRDVEGWVLVEDLPLPLPQVLADRLEGLPDVLENVLDAMSNPNEWILPQIDLRPDSETNVCLDAIELIALPPGTTVSTVGREVFVISRSSIVYRAKLRFTVNGSLHLYTIRWVPQFVAAPPCEGSHLLFEPIAMYYSKKVISAEKLSTYSDTQLRDKPQFLLINAMTKGGELLARAWCSDRGKHAVVRRGPGCCFSCAAKLAGGNGLGFNVLIWSEDLPG
jgi:hypothetical protein